MRLVEMLAHVARLPRPARDLGQSLGYQFSGGAIAIVPKRFPPRILGVNPEVN